MPVPKRELKNDASGGLRCKLPQFRGKVRRFQAEDFLTSDFSALLAHMSENVDVIQVPAQFLRGRRTAFA